MRKQTNKYATMCIYQTLDMAFIFGTNEYMKKMMWNRAKIEPSEGEREREREVGEKQNEMEKSVTTWL